MWRRIQNLLVNPVTLTRFIRQRRMRQATGIGERNFQRTSNQRNETMMKEASDFASHLRKCDRAIADMKSSCETVLSTTKIAMNAQLPRLYEDTAVRCGAMLARPQS